jgi:DNA-binding FadR family transcriptional regulator
VQELQRNKIRDVVASRLKSYITSKKLKTGDRLPTENELAVQFGVSRLSIREATKALEFLGLVHSKPGRGLSVGTVNIQHLAELLGFHPSLRQASPIQLIETRVIIEIGVLPHVMQRMQQDESIYASLSDIVDQLRCSRDLRSWIKCDVAFHRRLVESSGLSPLLAFNDLLTVFFQKFRESVKKAEWLESVDSHQRLIDKLRDQQLTEACDELRRHIESHKSRI